MDKQARERLSRYRLIRSANMLDDAPASTHIWLPSDGLTSQPDLDTMLCGAVIPAADQREVDIDEVALPQQCMRCVRVLLALANDNREETETERERETK